MPVYSLIKEHVFPAPSYADNDGLLAIGGDLHPERILLAYENGIFPWYNSGEPILWWSPNPRCVLYPQNLKVSKSMRKLIAKKAFDVSLNTCFQDVIEHCRDVKRKEQKGTWITKDMVDAYVKLHKLGYAHSIEVWRDGQLVGGLYGLSMGACFFGESMFSLLSNASKFGFILFCREIEKIGCKLIDCQTTTAHLLSLGAEEIEREKFLNELKIHCSDSLKISLATLSNKHFESA